MNWRRSRSGTCTRPSSRRSGDAGEWKQHDNEIVVIRTRPAVRKSASVLFQASATPAARGGAHVRPTCDAVEHAVAPALITLAAAGHLDFLCIHPFRDGNGRVSRLITLLQDLSAGYDVGRYVSLERTIEDTRERLLRGVEIDVAGLARGNKTTPGRTSTTCCSRSSRISRVRRTRRPGCGAQRGAKRYPCWTPSTECHLHFSLIDLESTLPWRQQGHDSSRPGTCRRPVPWGVCAGGRLPSGRGSRMSNACNARLKV